MRTSSTIQKISYSPAEINFITFDNASKEVFRLTSKPKEIKVNEIRVKEVSDISDEGWSWQTLKNGGVLRIRPRKGNNIGILK